MSDDARRRGGTATGHPAAVVTVGTFDGIHLGHQALIRRVTESARDRGLPSILLTFEPHPLSVVRPDAAPELLTTPAEKVELLAQTGVDFAALLAFTTEVSLYPARRFVDEVLIDRLGVACLVIGHDHGFGRNREGGPDLLRSLGREHGFDVEVVQPLSDATGAVSSTRIRRALAQGDVQAAAVALGRPYSVDGTVVRGDGRGRQLGFPTANLRPPHPRKLLPAAGIYAARAELAGRSLDGVVHVGPRPTFEDAAPTIEFHAFDFDGDLYARTLRLRFCQRLRGVERFDSAEALVRAMHADVDAGRRVLAAAGTCGTAPTPLP